MTPVKGIPDHPGKTTTIAASADAMTTFTAATCSVFTPLRLLDCGAGVRWLQRGAPLGAIDEHANGYALTLARGIRVLEIFSPRMKAVTTIEVADIVGISRAAVRRLFWFQEAETKFVFAGWQPC